MKFSTATAFLCSAGLSSTSAFVPVVTPSAAQSSSLSMAKGRDTTADGFAPQNDGQIPVRNILKNDEDNASKNKKPQKSQSIPFMDASRFLDGSMAADVGFDPLGFAGTCIQLKHFRRPGVSIVCPQLVIIRCTISDRFH